MTPSALRLRRRARKAVYWVYAVIWCSGWIYAFAGPISNEVKVLLGAILIMITPDQEDLFGNGGARPTKGSDV